MAEDSEVQKTLLERNKRYASRFHESTLPTAPQKKYAIVTCMDSRIDIFAAFGISLGDAHVIRNAGGSARDALRSLIISQQFLGTREIVLIKHTRCGLHGISNEEIQETIRGNLGEKAEEVTKGIDWLPFEDTEEEVKRDVELLKECEAVPEYVSVSGWVFDVDSGEVRRVV